MTNTEKFKQNTFLKKVLEHSNDSWENSTLVGGAVIDILEGRVPKDYDFLNLPKKVRYALELKFIHSTKTADTYEGQGVTVQILKKDKDDFDFKISQAMLIISKSKMELSIDQTSFNDKILIPCDKCWTEPKNALNALRRIPHWRKKGYTIPDITYLSLLGVTNLKS